MEDLMEGLTEGLMEGFNGGLMEGLTSVLSPGVRLLHFRKRQIDRLFIHTCAGTRQIDRLFIYTCAGTRQIDRFFIHTCAGTRSATCWRTRRAPACSSAGSAGGRGCCWRRPTWISSAPQYPPLSRTWPPITRRCTTPSHSGNVKTLNPRLANTLGGEEIPVIYDV